MTGLLGLVSDTSACLPPGLVPDVALVSIGLVIDGESHDESDLDAEEVYRRLAAGAVATTATPGPGRFLALYDELAGAGVEEVLSIHLDARLSGVVQAACIAAADAATSVRVIDTGQTSFGVAACVLEAERALRFGATAREAESAVRERARWVENAFVAPDAPRVGRVAARGFDVLSLAAGTQRQVATAGSEAAAVAAMAAAVAGHDGDVCAAVGHAGAWAARPADGLAAQLQGLSHVRDVLRYRVAPSVAVHAGPGTFGVVFWPAAPVRAQT